MKLLNARLPKLNQVYWANQLTEYSDRIINAKGSTINNVEFGKQDIRGGFSICLIDYRDCISDQKFFESKDMLLGYVQGKNEAARS